MKTILLAASTLALSFSATAAVPTEMVNEAGKCEKGKCDKKKKCDKDGE